MDPAAALDRMESIEGWFSRKEGELLLATAVRALAELPGAAIVEVGSYCGRSTVVLGEVARWQGGCVVAVDPHLGELGNSDPCFPAPHSTVERFLENIAAAGLQSIVRLEQRCSFELPWSGPIALLFLDALHDPVNVARDLAHFEPHLEPGGYVAFHDVQPNFDGPRIVSEAALAAGRLERCAQSETLLVLRKPGPTRAQQLQRALDEMAGSSAVRASRGLRALNPAVHGVVGRLGRALLQLRNRR